MFIVTGFIAGVFAVAITLWVFRTEIVERLSSAYGFSSHHRPVELLQDFELRQGDDYIGMLQKGARIELEGIAKDSPIEQYRIVIIWENRGPDRTVLFKNLEADADTLVYMSPRLN